MVQKPSREFLIFIQFFLFFLFSSFWSLSVSINEHHFIKSINKTETTSEMISWKMIKNKFKSRRFTFTTKTSIEIVLMHIYKLFQLRFYKKIKLTQNSMYTTAVQRIDNLQRVIIQCDIYDFCGIFCHLLSIYALFLDSCIWYVHCTSWQIMIYFCTFRTRRWTKLMINSLLSSHSNMCNYIVLSQAQLPATLFPTFIYHRLVLQRCRYTPDCVETPFSQMIGVDVRKRWDRIETWGLRRPRR